MMQLSRATRDATQRSRELLDLALVLKRLDEDIVQSTAQQVSPHELMLTIQGQPIIWLVKQGKLQRKGKSTSIYLEGACGVSFKRTPHGVRTRLSLGTQTLKKVTML